MNTYPASALCGFRCRRTWVIAAFVINGFLLGALSILNLLSHGGRRDSLVSYQDGSDQNDASANIDVEHQGTRRRGQLKEDSPPENNLEKAGKIHINYHPKMEAAAPRAFPANSRQIAEHLEKKPLQKEPDTLPVPPGQLEMPKEENAADSIEREPKIVFPPNNGIPQNRPNAPAVTPYPTLRNGNFIAPRRIVHFDLKGAPPKVAYFEQIFKLISGELGATGILMEYEDMFPYEGKLKQFRNGNAYSEADIRNIVHAAKQHNLSIIPLVQTFGHLEWILKYPEFAHLREVDRYPQVLCPSKNGSLEIVKEMINQVIALHPDITYFHMGADEAFQIGQCGLCRANIANKFNGSRERLMLDHIVSVASHIRNTHGKRVLMWHDMLANVDADTANSFKLGELVEPVVWAYAENLRNYLRPEMWSRFAATYPNIWGSSAFKGADTSFRWWSNVPHYLANHVSWVEQMTNHHKEFKEFRGLILTGWQRYDHFAQLCEIFPVGIPSLAVNLLTVKSGEYNESVLERAGKVLQCSGSLNTNPDGPTSQCRFPGSTVYRLVQELKALKGQYQRAFHDNQETAQNMGGWLSRFARKHSYSSMWYLDKLAPTVRRYQQEMFQLVKELRAALSEIFFADAVDEFIFENAEEDLNLLTEMSSTIERVGKMRFFPKRPFPILLESSEPKSTTAAQANSALKRVIYAHGRP